MRRLLLIVFAALAAAIFPVFAHAQLSIYFTSTNTRFGNVQNGQTYNNTTATYTNLFTTSWPPQFGGGATYDAVKAGPLNLGLDLRGSTNHGTTGADTVMFGPRLALRVPIVHIKPYLEAAGGYVGTRTNGTVTNIGGSTVTSSPSTISNQYAAWEVFAGVDMPILPHVDFRIVEIGSGKGYLAGAGISSLNFNNTNTQISLFSIDTGVVVRF